MNDKKVKLGQFFTQSNVWLKKHILDFINNSACNTIYDPFAGAGDILKCFNKLNVVALDIDKSLGWNYNDSLSNIPTIDNAIIVTNPPYLAKNSASKKRFNIDYFKYSEYEDLYLIALEKCLKAQKYVVAIIPESFINAKFKYKNRLVSITIIENNPFLDTSIPVCVACFNNVFKDFKDIYIYI